MTASVALEALRRRGLSYRPDVRRPSGAWEAQCPACRFYCAHDDQPLSIREAREGGHVAVWCRHRCSAESIEMALRAVFEPESLEHRIRRLELRLALIEHESTAGRRAA